MNAIPMVIALLLFVLYLASAWQVYSKTGKPGWACLIPIYNVIVFLRIVGRPVWWFVLLFIPGVNIIISLLLCLDLAAVFGKGTGFGLGLFFLPIILLPILAFGKAEYRGQPIRQPRFATAEPDDWQPVEGF